MSPAPEGGPRTYAIADSDDDCEHDALSELGGDGGANRYFHCRSCGGVLVKESPMQSEGTDADLGTVDPQLGDLLTDLEHYDQRTSPPLVDRAVDAFRRLLR